MSFIVATDGPQHRGGIWRKKKKREPVCLCKFIRFFKTEQWQNERREGEILLLLYSLISLHLLFCQIENVKYISYYKMINIEKKNQTLCNAIETKTWRKSSKPPCKEHENVIIPSLNFEQWKAAIWYLISDLFWFSPWGFSPEESEAWCTVVRLLNIWCHGNSCSTMTSHASFWLSSKWK